MADESRSSAGRSDNAAGSEDPQTWPQRALALDWSQCPAAEMIQTAQGRVWAFRGTQLPLWSLFRNMQLGHWVDEVLDNFPELNEELVVTVLNFAADRMYIPDL
jgi:uncharacterized protein (DUF433 family)